MARVPLITSPCPLRWKSMPIAGQDFCGQCRRQVHNLDGMNDAERQSFFATCSGEVCVAYTVRHPRAIASLLTLGVAASALAATGAVDAQSTGTANAAAQKPIPVEVTGPTCDPIELITVGGIKAAHDVKWIDERHAKVAAAPAIKEIDAAEWLPSSHKDAHAKKDTR